MASSASTSRGEDALVETVREIEEEIIFGRLRPRERLIEDDLIARLSRSRHVIRAALERLDTMGIVRRERNRGAVVRDFSAREVEEIYDMRALLHRRACELIPLPATRDLVDCLRDLQIRHARAVDRGDLREVYYLNNEFHDVFFDSCGNKLLADAIRQYAWLAHAIRSYRMADPVMLQQAAREHAEIVDALAAGEREELIRLADRHIEPSKKAYLQQENQVSSISGLHRA